jgi:molybdopterin-containing oxidoreductase family iron-sulfur binding subunit
MPLDLETIRERLAIDGGTRTWRGLEELCDTGEFRDLLEREFPDEATTWTDPVTRRQFLALMAASFALAGLSGCSPRPAPAEKIMPYVNQPEGLVPGKPLFFATAMTLGGLATGLLVKSHEGRPTKVEGNPKHPASVGATDVFAQASILGLYDPDRSQAVTYRGRPRGWNEFLAEFRGVISKQRQRRGAGLRILTETVGSPTLADQLDVLLKDKDFSEAKWYQYEPTAQSAPLEGARLAFGEAVQPIYNFKLADVVLSLDADFLGCGPAQLAYVRQFAERRRVRTEKAPPDQATMNRLYVAEPGLTSTGATADRRLPIKAGRIADLARAIAAGLKVPGAPPADRLSDEEKKWAANVARDLEGRKGRCIVLVGDGQPAPVHSLVHAVNESLGNFGTTVTFIPPVEARPTNQVAELRELVQDMKQGRVELLLLLGGNPVFTAPVDLEFARHLREMPRNALRVHLGLYQDETAILCDWHIPEAHYLESWSDARAFDGTASIVQPLIAPLYNGRSAHEFLAAMTESSERPGYEIVRDYWRTQVRSGSFEPIWRQALQGGVVPGSASAPRKVTLRKDWSTQEEVRSAPAGLEIVFRADSTLHDGRFANNGWLQELPKPVTRLTWDNAALVSPKTADALELEVAFGSHGGERGEAHVNVVELSYGGRTLVMPGLVVPGHADDSITVHFGNGRERAGQVGNGAGFNVYQLRTSAAQWFDSGLEVRKTNETYILASVQMHHSMESRAPVRFGTLEEFKKNPSFAKGELKSEPHRKNDDPKKQDRRLHPLSMYPEWPYDEYKWAMSIDLSACVGCGACVVACQAENNIPIVGKKEVTRGREMHWLRIDRYFSASMERPATHFQPVPCMHCEEAPCELVCPVNATVHSHDGLNDMVYNRCVGTRYCSNNCPYKVRRFNFLQYADYASGSLKLMHNPEVTVRSRGVMEKCTYCVQRIRAAEIQAEKEGRRIRDGEVTTACQQACPAQAIVFGDLNDKRSLVRRSKDEPHDYGLLAELNTRPRTTYLAQLKNPNQEVT